MDAQALLGLGMSPISRLAFLADLFTQAAVFALELLVFGLFLLQVWKNENDDDSDASGKEPDEEPADTAASFALGDKRADDAEDHVYHDGKKYFHQGDAFFVKCN
ncbi:MAG: hypothetical protein MK554_00020 [Planctomycetes bacterium]|nr:hypothetical protein [Planctomycetota bacterium]